MTELLKNEKNHFLIQFEEHLENYLQKNLGQHNLYAPLMNESITYSLKSNGKRFRPFLAYLIYKLGAKESDLLFSWALAIEFIHTYSLIHDDLPCMDNDDYRRGVLTNHKVYGDDIALLAGDSLISEAFRVIAEDEKLTADVRISLIQLLSQKIGPAGMVGGQVLDMKASQKIDFEQLTKIHLLKTSYLIEAAATGAAIIQGLPKLDVTAISEFSFHLGMAFQIKDDLLDYTSTEQDFKSYPHLLGKEKTQAELQKHSAAALEKLKSVKNKNTISLIELIQFNLVRES